MWMPEVTTVPGSSNHEDATKATRQIWTCKEDAGTEKRGYRFITRYFLFRFARGASFAVASVLAAAATCEGVTVEGSGNASSATSDVLLRPTMTGCSENTFVASMPIPDAETDPGADPDVDVLSITLEAPPSPSCAFAKAVKNASKSKSAADCAGGISSDDRSCGCGCVESTDVVASAAESRPMFVISALILACSASTSASISPASWYERARRASSSASWVMLGPMVSSLSNVSTLLLAPPMLFSYKASCASWGRSSDAGGVHEPDCAAPVMGVEIGVGTFVEPEERSCRRRCTWPGDCISWWKAACMIWSWVGGGDDDVFRTDCGRCNSSAE